MRGQPPPVVARPSRRVLIIDDNVDLAECLKLVLELSDHQVETANDGPSGLTRARSFQPQVVLCDIGLPGLDGYQVARTLRAEPAFRHTLLVALSGYALPEDVQRALEAGFNHHVAKPSDPEQLELLVASWTPPS